MNISLTNTMPIYIWNDYDDYRLQNQVNSRLERGLTELNEHTQNKDKSFRKHMHLVST